MVRILGNVGSVLDLEALNETGESELSRLGARFPGVGVDSRDEGDGERWRDISGADVIEEMDMVLVLGVSMSLILSGASLYSIPPPSASERNRVLSDGYSELDDEEVDVEEVSFAPNLSFLKSSTGKRGSIAGITVFSSVEAASRRLGTLFNGTTVLIDIPGPPIFIFDPGMFMPTLRSPIER